MSQVIDYRAAAPDTGSGAAWEQLHSLLVSGEAVLAHALQHRLYALYHRRRLAAASTGRFIYMIRPLLGGYQPLTIRWQDLREVELTVGMFSASLVIAYSGNLSDTASGEGGTRFLSIGGLEIPGAQALYRECQGQGQSWREKRRIRDLEEMRAGSGGVQIATGLYPPVGMDRSSDISGGAAVVGEDPARRLARVRDMLAQGLITDAEYEAVKAKIMGSL
jgi:hypothetical protein